MINAALKAKAQIAIKAYRLCIFMAFVTSGGTFLSFHNNI
jgi:hypothetical protein